MIFAGNVTIDRANLAVYHGDVGRSWCKRGPRGGGGVSFKIMEHLILSSGVTAPKLLDLLYDADANGGPILGCKHIHIMICQLQPDIEELGLTLKKHRHNSHTVYRITQPHVARQTT